MSNIELKALYGRYIAALNARDFAAVEPLIAPEVHVNGTPYKRADVLGALKGMVDAVPDYHWTVQDLFVEDGRIAARLHDTGTPVKPFLGHQPTGASLAVIEYGSYRVRDGQFVDMWYLIDAATAGQQLQAAR